MMYDDFALLRQLLRVLVELSGLLLLQNLNIIHIY